MIVRLGLMLALLFVDIFLLSGCHQGGEASSSSSYEMAPKMNEAVATEASADAALQDMSAEGGSPPAPGRTAAEPVQDATPKPMRIYRATLRLQVDAPEEAAAKARRIAERHGAWLQTERQEREPYEHRVYFEFRVPPAQLDTVIAQLVSMANFVAQKDMNTDEVGAQYADLSARLQQKKDVAAQYRQLLTRAGSIKDILEVQEHIRHLQEEIDATEGQLRYLSRQVAHSTLTVTFFRPMEGSRQPEAGFWARLGTAFSNGWSALQALILAIVTAWGIIVPIGLGVLIYLRWNRRKRREAEAKRKAEAKQGAGTDFA